MKRMESRTAPRGTTRPTERPIPANQPIHKSISVALDHNEMNDLPQSGSYLLRVDETHFIASRWLYVVVQRNDCNQDERQHVSDNVEQRDLKPSRKIESKRTQRLEDADRHQVVPHHSRDCSPVQQPSAEPAPRPVRQPTSDPSVAVVRISALVAHCRLPADPHRNHLRHNSRNDWDLQPCNARAREARLPWMSHVRQQDKKCTGDADMSKHC